MKGALPCSPCIFEGVEKTVSNTLKKQPNSWMTWVFGARHGPSRCAANLTLVVVAGVLEDDQSNKLLCAERGIGWRSEGILMFTPC